MSLLPPLLAWCAVAAQDAPQPGPRWEIVPPIAFESRSGAELAAGEAGQVLVRGEGGPWDVHTFELLLPGEREALTGLRIEFLPHESLPAGGPGRGVKGDVHVAEVRLAAGAAKKRARIEPVPIRLAASPQSEGGLPPRYSIDNNPSSGWGMRKRVGQAGELILLPAEPVPVNGSGTRLFVTLAYGLGGEHNRGDAGCLRLSVTADPDPLGALDDPLSGAGWLDVERRVNRAIDQGIDYLLSKQELDGSWGHHQPNYPAGQTALSLYTLLKSGVPASHPAVRRAVAFTRATPSMKTYGRGCQLMALCALGEEQDEELIEMLVEALCTSDLRGVWNYPGSGVPDLSNTQYAVLGLRAAQRAGFRVPKDVWADIAEGTLAYLDHANRTKEAAGFGYRPGQAATGSMTAAGVAILAICAEQTRRLPKEVKDALADGLRWVEAHYSVTSNPHPHLEPGKWGPLSSHLLYYLYGLERVCGILGLEHLAGRNWYRDGALQLVEQQKGDGSWEDNQSNTCFGLLFLARATHPLSGLAKSPASKRNFGADDPSAPLSMRVSAAAEARMWVSSWGRRTLERYAAQGDAKAGPIVKQVVYEEVPDGDREPRVLSTVAGDASKPAGLNRFAARHEFPRAGKYRLRAVATLVDPDDGEEIRLESPVLEIVVSQVHRPRFLDYSLDPGRNLLASAASKVSASSLFHDSCKPERAFDNLQSTMWRGADDDPLPWIKIELHAELRADTFLFTHAARFSSPDVNYPARIRSFDLILNDKKIHPVEMLPGDGTKTTFTLPRPVKVRTLELRVREVADHGAAPDKRSVGFNEVELQLRR